MNAPTPPLPSSRAHPALSRQRGYGCFVRQGQAFGLDVNYLQEVVHARQLTPVPLAPALLAGVVSLRGEILPVALIDSLLALEPCAFAAHKPIMVLRRADLLVGLQVDVVERVVTFPGEELLPSPLAGKYPHFAHLHHAATSRRLTNLLDAVSLLDQLAEQITTVVGRPAAGI